MRFIRFVIQNKHPDSGVEAGLFDIAYQLRDASAVAEQDRRALAEALCWFEDNLDTPKRFNRSSSKGFYRRNTRGIAWFKDSATEHLSRMHQLKALLERYGHHVVMVSEARVGYVVYEDERQVIAEPFADTRTQ